VDAVRAPAGLRLDEKRQSRPPLLGWPPPKPHPARLELRDVLPRTVHPAAIASASSATVIISGTPHAPSASVPKDHTSHLRFIFMNTWNLDAGGSFQLVVDEQPILCAFTLSELERLVDWGSWKEREIALESEDSELLERIKRLAVAAAERQARGGGESSRSPSARPPGITG
jgi:hypothetical protein